VLGIVRTVLEISSFLEQVSTCFVRKKQGILTEGYPPQCLEKNKD
jgi:hypothetical protein